MNQVQKTSMLICLATLVVFTSIGVVVKWPQIAKWLAENSTVKPGAQAIADPFNYDPPLPSYVKELHPQYTLKAELFPDRASIAGELTLSFDNPGTKDIRLYLYDYAFSPMTIKSVRHGDSGVPFERRGNTVVMKNAFTGEGRITLTILFDSSVPRSGTRFGVKDGIWILTNWYPMLGALNQAGVWYDPPHPVGYGDPFVYHYADYDVSFTSPESYHWVTSWGQGESKSLGDGRKQVRYQARRILNFSLVGSPAYIVERMYVDPHLTVDVAATDRVEIDRLKVIAESALTTYTELYGPLPYPYVAIAETSPGTVFAMEYANLAIVRKDLFNEGAMDHWLPHELAHLWWYNSVETLEAEYGWLDEGLVELSVCQYMKKRYGEDEAAAVLARYADNLKRLNQQYPDGTLGKKLAQFQNVNEFDWTWYSKGALLYQNLRRQIGDDAFFAFLKRVQYHYHGSVIGPEHLDQALSQTLNGEARYFTLNLRRSNAAGFAPLHLEPYLDIAVDGRPFYPSLPARRRDGTVYLPLRDLMEKLGYHVVWSAEKGAIRMKAGIDEVVLHEGSREVRHNGKVYQLSKPLIEVRDRKLVSLDFFERVLNLKADYDAQTNAVRIAQPQR